MKVAIGLGCSLGDRRATLELTIRKIAATAGITVLRTSRWYRTPPMRGGTAKGWFLNGVVLIETDRTLEDLLALCVSLESGADRRRSQFWGDRPLDVDLLLAEGAQRAEPHLQVPHPGIASRAFVLRPLVEVWRDARDPKTGRPWADLLPGPVPRPVPVGVPSRRL